MRNLKFFVIGLICTIFDKTTELLMELADDLIFSPVEAIIDNGKYYYEKFEQWKKMR